MHIEVLCFGPLAEALGWKSRQVRLPDAARIIDLITTKEYEESMLQQIINYCILKVDFIDFFCSGNFYKESLMKKKFLLFNLRIN